MRDERPLTHFEDYCAHSPTAAKLSAATHVSLKSMIDVPLRLAQTIKPGRDLLTKAQAFKCVFPDMATIESMFGLNQAQVMWAEQFAVVNVHRAGSRIYRVAEGLTQLLRDCDFKVEMRSVRPPHPAIYVTWENSGLDIALKDGTNYPLEGAYVIHLDEPDNADEPGWQLYVVLVSRKSDDGSGNMVWMRIPWEPTATTIVSPEILAENVTNRFRSRGGSAGVDLASVFNLVVNTLLYLTLPTAELRLVQPEIARRGLHSSNPRKAEKAARSLERQTAHRCFTLVGESVTYVRRGAGHEATGHGTGRRLSVQQLVSGHFKTVRFGEGNAQHKIHFVAPYYRGPKTAGDAAAIHISKVLGPTETRKE